MNLHDWQPIHYGNRYQIAKLRRDRLQSQITDSRKFDTLAEARAECERRNAR
jgi:hypothetical protein